MINMLATRNYAYYYSAKCDCCKRVRKVKTKIDVIDVEKGLLGELTLCPTCLNALNNMEQEIKNDDAVYDEDSMDIEDLEKLGYTVTKL